MMDGDYHLKDVVCGKCDVVVMRLYERAGRLTFDLCEAAHGGDEHPLKRRVWFRGVDAQDELKDTSGSTVTLDCRCRSHRVRIQEILETARQSRQKRIVLPMA